MNDYRYVCDIARGGLGRVSLAYREDGDFLRLYAIKRLLPAYEGDTAMRSMFADEGRVAGLLRHPNVVSVVDVGDDEDGMYLVMDYVEGVPLSSVITRLKSKGEVMPIQHCIRVIRQVAEGLHAAHELRGNDGTHLSLVHRDVSPQNILVEPTGVVRVTDFGIAKALGRKSRTSTGFLKGKTGYIAPECLKFEEPDRRADLFSLGVVLYELVSTERLYGGKDLAAVARRILHDPPPDLALHRQDVPDALVALGFELCAKEPDLRPANAKDVIRRLDAILLELLATEEAEDFEEYLKRQLDFSVVESRRQLVEEVRANPITEVTPPPMGAAGLARPPHAEPPERRRFTSLAVGAALVGVGLAAGIAVTSVGGPADAPDGPDGPVAPVGLAEEPPASGVEVAGAEEPSAAAPSEPGPTPEAQAADVPADMPAEPVGTETTAEAEPSEATMTTQRPRMRRRRAPAMRTRPSATPERWGWGDVGMQ